MVKQGRVPGLTAGDKPSESGDGTSISLHEIQQVYLKGTVYFQVTRHTNMTLPDLQPYPLNFCLIKYIN